MQAVFGIDAKLISTSGVVELFVVPRESLGLVLTREQQECSLVQHTRTVLSPRTGLSSRFQTKLTMAIWAPIGMVDRRC